TSKKPDFAALQQTSLDTPPSSVTRGANPDSRQERTMDQKTVFTQMQQFGSEWLKLVTESTNRFTAALSEVEKYEKQGVAPPAAALAGAGGGAREATTAGEQSGARGRKAAAESPQRPVGLPPPKN